MSLIWIDLDSQRRSVCSVCGHELAWHTKPTMHLGRWYELVLCKSFLKAGRHPSCLCSYFMDCISEED